MKSADVVIIGGGVIGSAIAYYLSSCKLDIALVERKGPASEASGACDGAILMQSKKPGVHMQMAMKSRGLLEGLEKQLPMPVEFEKNGGLIVAENEEQYGLLKQNVEVQRRAGLEVELLDSGQLQSLSPHLSPDLLGASYSAVEGKINPLALTIGFGEAARKQGVTVLNRTQVLDIETANGGVTKVVTDKGNIQTGTVINAAGVYAPRIGAMVDVDIPINPKRGQLLVSAQKPGLLKPCLLSASYLAAKLQPSISGSNGGGLSMDQTRAGNILIGSTRELVGYDKTNTLDGLKQIAARAVRIIPELKKMMLIRSFAGLRPYTPDGLPILGKSDKIDGFFIAAGHEGDGITLSAITGKLMSELIVNGEASFPLEPFGLNRFAAGET